MINHETNSNSSAKPLVASKKSEIKGANVRINKFLSSAGVSSRRDADKLIEAGKVLVNHAVAKVGVLIDPDLDEIRVNDKIIKTIGCKQYFAFYKPSGIITSMSEKQGDSIARFIPKNLGLFPVGRLDKDSEGLLIITNDGDFSNQLIHPSNHYEKSYKVFASSQNKINVNEIDRSLIKGFNIEGKLMRASSVGKIELLPKNNFVVIDLTLITGYNRQIRRMLEKLGLKIDKLIRYRISNLKLSDLKIKPGEYKEINKMDIL